MKITWDDFIKLLTPKLEKENFIEQIVEYGYFAEQVPSCFSSKTFATELSELLPLALCTKSQVKSANATLPTTLSMRKDDISRRILALPNPKAFLRLAKLMQEHWEDIQNFSESENSCLRNCIQASLGYKYRLKVDVANCYNSIYTHSVAWAICGKDEAKRYLRTKKPDSSKRYG